MLTLIGCGAQLGRTQNPSSGANGPTPVARSAADPETLTVEFLSRLSADDLENLKDYRTAVVSRTKDRWMQALPAQAKAPQSVPGEVKIDCWVHTDGRVTGLLTEESSGKAPLDRAAWAAITGSAPYDAFPYGIAADQAKVRFTFVYNGGAASDDKPVLGSKKLPR